MNIIVAILIFAFLIFFHELGHFLFAKKFGIKVNEFCIGFGPTLVGFTKGDTTYSIKLIPMGGACMMEGEDEESEDEAAFNKKPLIERALVVFAGPFFNFILAFVLSIVIVSFVGVDMPTVTNVSEGYPAMEAGIKAGDEIVKINGKKIVFYRDISTYTLFNGGDEVSITYKRDGNTDTVKLTPKFDKESGRYFFGIAHGEPRVKVGPFATLKYSFFELRYQINTVIQSLRLLVTGKISANEMSGPVGIVKAIGDTYEQSMVDGIFYVVMNMINFTVMISANLGVMNLLPIPALDGGRLLIFLVEAIRRKKLSEEIEGRIHIVGFALLMLLMVFVLVNDVRKLFM